MFDVLDANHSGDTSTNTGVFIWVGVGYGIYHRFQQYFSYIMAISFIDGGNQSIWRKPLTGRK